MNILVNGVDNIVATIGIIVIVPLVLFIMCIVSGVGIEKSFRSALLCAVGIQGFKFAMNAYIALIAPFIQRMTESGWLKAVCLDMGWQSASIIAFSTSIGIIFMVIALIIQLLLFVLKWTDVFMASDLWNNYSFIVWGSMLYFITNKFVIAMICMIIQLLYILLFSQVLAKRWSNYYQCPNCCMTAPHHLEAVPYAIIMNFILNKIGINKLKINAKVAQSKLKFVSEPMHVGLIVGLILGILCNISTINTVDAWKSILLISISTATIMAIFPKIGSIFASSFTYLTETVRNKMIKFGENREWYLAANDGAGFGETNTLVTGMILIPIIIVLSFVLPGNIMIPIADLCALPYMVEVFICISNGNIPKSIIMGAIWFSLGLIICSSCAPIFTEVARTVGFEIPGTITFIISFGIMAHPLIAGIFFVIWKGGVVGLVALLVVYLIFYIVFKKNRQSIYAWLETNTGEIKEEQNS